MAFEMETRSGISEHLESLRIATEIPPKITISSSGEDGLFDDAQAVDLFCLFLAECSSKFPETTLTMDFTHTWHSAAVASLLNAARTQLVDLSLNTQFDHPGYVNPLQEGPSQQKLEESLSKLERLDFFTFSQVTLSARVIDRQILGIAKAISRLPHLRSVQMAFTLLSGPSRLPNQVYETIPIVLAQMPKIEQLILLGIPAPDLHHFFSTVKTSPSLKDLRIKSGARPLLAAENKKNRSSGSATQNVDSVVKFLQHNPTIRAFSTNLGDYSIEAIMPALISDNQLLQLDLRATCITTIASHEKLESMLTSLDVCQFTLQEWKWHSMFGGLPSGKLESDFFFKVDFLTCLNKHWPQERQRILSGENVTLKELVDICISVNKSPRPRHISVKDFEMTQHSALFYFLSKKPSLLLQANK